MVQEKLAMLHPPDPQIPAGSARWLSLAYVVALGNFFGEPRECAVSRRAARTANESGSTRRAREAAWSRA